MLNLGIIDLVIGLFFIYFILSVVCTSIVEVFAQWKNLRVSNLNEWIKDTFNTSSGGDLGDQILKHGLVDGLTQKGKFASFIPANVFTSALFDIIYQKYTEKKGDANASSSFDHKSLREAIEDSSSFIPADLKRYMIQALDDCKDAEDSLSLLKKRIEMWYEDAMDRLTGTYKKKVRYITIIVAALVTIATNADTITITKYLKENPDKAQILAATATKAATDSTLYRQTLVQLDSISCKLDRKGDSTTSSVKETVAMMAAAKKQNDSLYYSMVNMGLPLGWSTANLSTCTKDARTTWDKVWCYIKMILSKLVGLIATIAALTLGAPFWFDMINKVVNIRSAGKKPTVKRE